MSPQIVPSPDERQPSTGGITHAGVAHGTSAAQRLEVLRVSLLRHAAKSGPHGLPVNTYHLCVRVGGLDASLPDIARELPYLLDKGLLAAVPKPISPENACYRIHAAGRDLLAEYGLDSDDG